MYLWTHTFMWPVFQGFKQVREPAVYVLAENNKGIWNTLILRQIMALKLISKIKYRVEIGHQFGVSRVEAIISWFPTGRQHHNFFLIVRTPKIVDGVKGRGDVFYEALWKCQRGLERRIGQTSCVTWILVTFKLMQSMYLGRIICTLPWKI